MSSYFFPQFLINMRWEHGSRLFPHRKGRVEKSNWLDRSSSQTLTEGEEAAWAERHSFLNCFSKWSDQTCCKTNTRGKRFSPKFFSQKTSDGQQPQISHGNTQKTESSFKKSNPRRSNCVLQPLTGSVIRLAQSRWPSEAAPTGQKWLSADAALQPIMLDGKPFCTLTVWWSK